MTALGGVPVYLDLTTAMRLPEIIAKHLHIKQQGWTDSQTVMSLILLNLAGGDCVNDLVRLEGDSGFCRVLRRIEQSGLKRAQRREMERRWRKEQTRSIPSASSVFRYLAAFHDRNQEELRKTSDENAPVYRYLAIREKMGSGELPGMETMGQLFLFPTMLTDSQRYKIFGLATNMDWEGEKLIHWQRKRSREVGRGALGDEGGFGRRETSIG